MRNASFPKNSEIRTSTIFRLLDITVLLFITSSFLLLVVRPGATFVVVRPPIEDKVALGVEGNAILGVSQQLSLG